MNKAVVKLRHRLRKILTTETAGTAEEIYSLVFNLCERETRF